MNVELKVSELMICKFECDYPVLNVRQEIIKMQNWWMANPRRRKSNEYRFVVNWLNREHAKVAIAQANARSYARVGEYREPSKEAVERMEESFQEAKKLYGELE